RLNFGSSLSNVPETTPLGDLNGTLPETPSKLFLTKDANGDWFLFVTGGTTAANSSISRVDFGKSLNNTPNSVNFGNLGGVLNGPRGICVEQVGNNYYGHLVNNVDNELVRLEFGSNMSFTPNVVDLGATFGLGTPSDMIPVVDKGARFAFVSNLGNNLLTRLN